MLIQPWGPHRTPAGIFFWGTLGAGRWAHQLLREIRRSEDLSGPFGSRHSYCAVQREPWPLFFYILKKHVFVSSYTSADIRRVGHWRPIARHSDPKGRFPSVFSGLGGCPVLVSPKTGSSGMPGARGHRRPDLGFSPVLGPPGRRCKEAQAPDFA